MPLTTGYSFGDVVLVPFPFTDQSGSKKRPAVIVSSADYQAQRRDLVIMAITSQIRPRPAFAEFTVAAWKKAGLIAPSAVKPVLTTIEKRLAASTRGDPEVPAVGYDSGSAGGGDGLYDTIPWKQVAIVAVVAVFLYGLYRQWRRDADLPQRAIELGFRFLGSDGDSARFLEEQGPFALLKLGYGPSVRDVMRGERGGYDITVFDYGARTRANREGGQYWRTVVRVASPSLRLPAFTLEWQSSSGDGLRRPEDRLERLERHSLYAEVRDALACVPFDHHPRFSHDYKVRGNDDAAIAATFGEAALAVFEQNRGWNIESLGDRLLLDRDAFTVQPAKLEAFLDEVIGLVGVLEGKP